MENYLLNYDEVTGEIKGFYLRSIHKIIPLPIKEITEEKHNFYMENSGKYKLNPILLEDELIPYVEPLPQPKSEIEILKETVDMLVLSSLGVF